MHKNIIKEEYYRKYMMKGEEDKCKMCGNRLLFYGITKGYYKKFCKKCNRPKTKEDHVKIYGNLNRFYSEKNKRSFSCSKLGLDVKYGKEKSKAIRKSMGLNKKQLIEKHGISEFKRISNLRGKSTRREYYLEQANCNYDLADYLLKRRQSTFSLNKCIMKYGEEKGRKIWNERQDRWQKTLNSKSEEEKERINKSKFPGYKKPYYMSKAEKELAKILKCSSQLYIKKGGWYDLYYGNKIIEYNGDYFHCNPSKYDRNYYNEKLKMFAYQKWNQDELKIKVAINNGYKVLVIWENEHKRDKNGVIKRCMEFLYG